MKRINKVAILGAGTMGARIAAHFANAGIPSHLLDIVPPDADGATRNKIAAAGLEAAKKSKPAAFMDASLARLVTIGNFEDDLKKLAEVDWIIEAVVENLEIKRTLLKKVEAIRKPGTIITTNTSGLPVGKIAEGFSDDFRRAWFGTHFFNPPRFMRLLEIIPTPEADRAAIDAISHFCDVRLGKGVVIAKDTPNFIGNRIGTFSVLNVMRLMQEMDLSIEDVDALTGQAVGWPKSATFRTIDLVGLDILGHVVSNMTSNVRDERSDLKLPDFFNQMLQKKWLGDKTKGGFYKKAKAGDGKEDERLALDWKTLEYHPRQKPKFPALDMAKNLDDTGARLRMLLGLEGSGPQKGDKAAAFLWSALTELWTYSANRVPEISDTIVEIDRAMKLGFNWELGPFELWDAAGVEATVARMKKEGKPVAASVEKLLAAGQKSWYADDPKSPAGRKYWDLTKANWEPVEVPSGVWSVAGSVIHSMKGEQDIPKMGGLLKHLPLTSLSFLAAWLAISGIPPFSGFFSKDEILWRALATPNPLFAALPQFLYFGALVAAFLTAYYMTRLVVLVFFGEFRGTPETFEHLHESPRIMTVPLLVLAAGSLTAGWIGLPSAIGGGNRLGVFLDPIFHLSQLEPNGLSPKLEPLLMLLSFLVAGLGMGLAWYVYGLKHKISPAVLGMIPGGRKVIEQKYYVDEIYEVTVVRWTRGFAHWVSDVLVEQLLINRVVDAAVEALTASARSLKRLQTGLVRFYLVYVAAGAALLVYLLVR